MKIAVSYENGQVFQHFGKTEEFKVYDIEDKKVLSSEVMSTNGVGHEALADFLVENDIDIVICGGLGEGAMYALQEGGIEVFAGVEGDADSAVKAYLDGTLDSTGVNCECDGEEEDCDCGCGGDCGGCGGGCGGCHTIIEGKNSQKQVKVHYRGTFNDGTQFDSSYDRGEPLEFICGVGMMIPGFDKAVVDMEVGEEVDIHLMPEEAYGMPNPNLIFTVSIAEMPGTEELVAGQHVYLSNAMGQPIPVVVTAKDEEYITFDANSEMAGKELNFHVELVEVVD
ncbi:MAG: FKBP-type peptidyl-prolyl cis-trans isomerase [Lachnospiraceae bacterium]|nr:FKBP-type peptidyl-prolyl cis-trans isomerase [Lachnospiraceae bacterium]